MSAQVTVIGGGLSGCECALQLASRGIPVELWEMRPDVQTEAHTTGLLAELVCSNSFKSTDESRAQGLLKLELKQLNCHLLTIAHDQAIPGGAALVVDRQGFSKAITKAIETNPLITLHRAEFHNLPQYLSDGQCAVIATGPLTGSTLWRQLSDLIGDGGSYFYDATSPVLSRESLDDKVVFAQSRYGKGDGDDYLNCPLDKQQYIALREALISAEQYPINEADEYKLFEGCLPIEELAQRGENTMAFGPLKPKGLHDPRTGEEPYACAQLRFENAFRDAVSLVGFQTRLRFGEQERVFRMIPGLEGAKFMRHGRMHRNSYLEAPMVMLPTLQLKAAPNILVTGQLTGLEGYMNAIATGLWAGVNAARIVRGNAPVVPPERSCLGAMLRFMTNTEHKHYRPTAFQFGMLKWLPEKIRKHDKAKLIRESAEAAWEAMQQYCGS